MMISPKKEARIAGVLYLFNMLTGVAAMGLLSRNMQAAGNAVNFVSTILYTGVTLLLWHLFRHVNPWIAAVAALVSILGCWLPILGYMPAHVSNFIFFGIYCLLIAYLIVRSRFMPNAVGALMACAGVSWLTTISPSLSRTLSPLTMIVGLLGEGTLILYLLIWGLDEQGWRDQEREHSQVSR
jgi:hypothetical protein